VADLFFYTAAEVADLLRLNHQVVQRKLQAGDIPGFRIGREWRVEREQLMTWLERHSNQLSHQDREPWFDAGGRLTALPAQRSRRTPVLRRIAESIAPDRTYTERQLGAVLRRFHDDVATLRREMVAERLLVRTPAGIYKRASEREPVLRRA
jgi:excisionase family DNA binding protein